MDLTSGYNVSAGISNEKVKISYELAVEYRRERMSKFEFDTTI